MSRRTERVAEVIREVVSSALLFEVNDPRVKGVTVTRAEVAGDLRNAKVFVSIMGDERERSLCEHGLNSCRGFLQRKVAERLQTRYTPVIRLVVDESVKKSLEMSRLLRDLVPDSTSDDDEEPMDGEE